MPTPDITLITLDYPPERGGVARYLGNLVRESDGAINVLVPEGHAVNGPGQVAKSKMFWKSWPHWWPLVGACRRTPHDGVIFVSHVFPIGTAAWISKLLGGPRYAVLFHGLDLRLAQALWKRWLLRRICRNAKALFANSEHTQQDLLRLVPRAAVTVITPGVEMHSVPSREEARRMLDLDQEQTIVLSVSRLVPRKGIDISLKALSRIQAKQDVEYVVLGDGPERQRLEKLAEESKTRVRWILEADDQEKWLWYAAADIFLLPVREEGNDVEGFGIVYLEAALAGIPAVAGKSGGIGEAVAHETTGLLVNPKSIDDVEVGIMRLLEDADLRQKLGQTARRRAMEEFKWRDRWVKFAHTLGVDPENRIGLPGPQTPDIAIVIPCYNHADVLGRTLEALAKQTLQPAEVVVVDDGSTDNPETLARAFAARLPLRFVRFETNRGAPAARNEGARQTSAPFLLFLDADAALIPQALAAFHQTLDHHPEVDFAYSDFLWGSKLFRGKPFEAEALKRKNYIHTSSLLRRQAFPGFDETLKKFQDWDLWLTMAQKGSCGIWIKRELYRIEPRKQGISRWLPRAAHLIPWNSLGFQPKEIGRYREAEKIVRRKHGI